MYKLYYYPSNANLAPHMLLEEIGADYELILVDRTQDAHKKADYLKLNPTGLIPVLIDGDLVLPETAAICLHLVDKHPDAGLAPRVGTAERAQFYRWLVYLTNTVQAGLVTYFYPDRLVDTPEQAKVVQKHTEARIGDMFDIIEAQFASHDGPWLLGEQYSAVDPYLFMLSRWTRNLTKPARDRPQLKRFLDAMIARPAVMKAHEFEGLKAPYY